MPCNIGLPDFTVADGAATLSALTAAAVARVVPHLPDAPRSWIVAGGGARNPTLMKMPAQRCLQRLNADVDVQLAGDVRARGTLRGRQLIFAGRKIEDVQADLSSTTNANTLTLRLGAEPLALSARARGVMTPDDGAAWSTAFDMGEGDALSLKLTRGECRSRSRPVRSQLGRACLLGGDARLLLAGR